MKHPEKINLLIVSKSYYYSLTNVNMRKYLLLNQECEGDFLGVTDVKSLKSVPVDGFWLRAMYLPKKLIWFKPILNTFYILFAIVVSTKRHYLNKKYDVIIAREPQFAGPVAWIISKLLRIEVIVELNGNYKSEYVWGDVKNRAVRALKRLLSDAIVPFVIKRSAIVKLLYPTQIDGYGLSESDIKGKLRVFHEYTPISLFEPSESKEKVILSMGFPAYIKGFDILIEAFKLISKKIPNYSLSLVGYLTEKERSALESIAGGNQQVNLLGPLEYEAAMKKMADCEMFVLASRTEGMGRVLLEAMAHGKPVIGSDADGIPFYIEHEKTGLIFRSGNVEELANAILKLATDDKLCSYYAKEGLISVRRDFCEKEYVRKYMEMIYAANGKPNEY